MLYTYVYIHILYRSIVVYHSKVRKPWRSRFPRGTTRIVEREIRKARAFSNIVDERQRARVHTHTHVQQFFQGKTRHLFVITCAFVCDKRRRLISATEDVSIFKAERNTLWHRSIGTWSRTAAQHRLESFQFSRAHIRKTLLACLDRSFLSFIVCTRLRR